MMGGHVYAAIRMQAAANRAMQIRAEELCLRRLKQRKAFLAGMAIVVVAHGDHGHGGRYLRQKIGGEGIPAAMMGDFQNICIHGAAFRYGA